MLTAAAKSQVTDPLLMLFCSVPYRDVKQSSKIRTLNKTFKFGFVFWAFHIRLLTAFYRMPLFIFDQDCVDRSVHMQSGRCCCDVRSCGSDGSVLLAVAGSRGWRMRDVGDRRQRVGTTWVSTRGKWHREIMPPVVRIFVRLLYGKERSGRARQIAQKLHLFTTIVMQI